MSSPNPLARKEKVSECFTQNSVIIQCGADTEIRITINLSDYRKDGDRIPTEIHIALLLRYFCPSHSWVHVSAFKHTFQLKTGL